MLTVVRPRHRCNAAHKQWTTRPPLTWRHVPKLSHIIRRFARSSASCTPSATSVAKGRRPPHVSPLQFQSRLTCIPFAIHRPSHTSRPTKQASAPITSRHGRIAPHIPRLVITGPDWPPNSIKRCLCVLPAYAASTIPAPLTIAERSMPGM